MKESSVSVWLLAETLVGDRSLERVETVPGEQEGYTNDGLRNASCDSNDDLDKMYGGEITNQRLVLGLNHIDGYLWSKYLEEDRDEFGSGNSIKGKVL